MYTPSCLIITRAVILIYLGIFKIQLIEVLIQKMKNKKRPSFFTNLKSGTDAAEGVLKISMMNI